MLFNSPDFLFRFLADSLCRLPRLIALQRAAHKALDCRRFPCLLRVVRTLAPHLVNNIDDC